MPKIAETIAERSQSWSHPQTRGLWDRRGDRLNNWLNRLTRNLGLVIVLTLVIAPSGRGQTTRTSAIPSGVVSDSVDVAGAPVVVANYTIPETPFDWSVPPLVRTCQAVFEATLVQLPARDTHVTTRAASTSGETGLWNAIPENMVTTGRDCLRRVRLADLSPDGLAARAPVSRRCPR